MTPEQHGAWQATLDEYIDLGDRSREPVFVGRDEHLEKIERSLRTARSDASSRTVIFQGAPGAGKSALLRELRERYEGADAVLAVEVDPGDMCPRGVFDALAQALDIERRGETETSRRVEGVAKLAVVGAEVSTTILNRSPSDTAELERTRIVPWQLMRKRLGDALAHRAVLLLCDEAQTLLHEGAPPGVRQTVQSLHRGDPARGFLRIVPVFAGLSDTGDVLDECGVTREAIDNAMSLPPLDIARSSEYATKILGYLGVNTNTSDARALVDWAVGCSDGWPHHLRMAMTGIAHAMRAQNSPNLRTLDRPSIVEYVTERRNDYYGKRIKATKHPAFRDAFRALALKTAGDTAEVAELVMVAKQALHGADAALEPPAPYALVASAIHAGILQHVSSTHLTCPIASMRPWLETGQYTAPAIPEFGH